jgi:hypothetical protein
MLGYGTNTDSNIVTPTFISGQQIYNAMYVSDTFQVSRKLTLNLGLRYDLQGPWSERYDRIDILFSMQKTGWPYGSAPGGPGIGELSPSGQAKPN